MPSSLFHGGFGLVAAGSIPKPTFWIFAFYKKLAGFCVPRSEDAVVLWNPVEEGETGKTIAFSLEQAGKNPSVL